MPRVLVAARKRVAEADRTAYRRAAAELAGRFEARGQHLWVFRSAADPGLVLEFREGKHADALGPADTAEAGLCEQIDRLARVMEPAAHWEEWPQE